MDELFEEMWAGLKEDSLRNTNSGANTTRGLKVSGEGCHQNLSPMGEGFTQDLESSEMGCKHV